MRILVFLIALSVLIICSAVQPLAKTAVEAPKKVLAIQSQVFAPYERSFKGFKTGLEASDYTGNIEVVHFNAKSDLKLMEQKILEVQKSKEFDLIFTLGTRATRMAMDNIDDIPIIFTDLAAPEYSGIIKDWKSSGTNVTGVETPKYLSKGVEMLHNLIQFKTVGMIYLQGSPSHEGALRQMKLISKHLGTKLIYDGFPLKNAAGKNLPDAELREQISMKLDELLPQVDVFFVQPSRSFVNNFDIFLNGFRDHKVLSAGDPVYIEKGIVLGLDRNKFEFGKQCARYAVKIFRGTPPASLPMDVGQQFTISFNLKAAAVVGFTPPLDLLAAADAIYQEYQAPNPPRIDTQD